MFEPIALGSSAHIVHEKGFPSQKEWNYQKVMGVALIIFGIIATCAFLACAGAAIALGSSALAIGAGVIGMIGVGVLITSLILSRDDPVEPPQKPAEAHVNITPVNKEQSHRPSVPQYSLTKKPSSGKINLHRTGNHLSRNTSTSTLRRH